MVGKKKSETVRVSNFQCVVLRCLPFLGPSHTSCPPRWNNVFVRLEMIETTEGEEERARPGTPAERRREKVHFPSPLSPEAQVFLRVLFLRPRSLASPPGTESHFLQRAMLYIHFYRLP